MSQSKLLDELRREIQALKKENEQLQKVLAVLQSRLDEKKNDSSRLIFRD